MKKEPEDKRKMMRQSDHLTRPPRMEGRAKNRGLIPRKKKRGQHRKEKKSNVSE